MEFCYIASHEVSDIYKYFYYAEIYDKLVSNLKVL